MANERLRSIKVSQPPSSGNPTLDSWMREVSNAINNFPVSLFSTSDGPNSSNVTAPQGFLGIEFGSSSSRFWIKESGSTSTGWQAVSYDALPAAYGELNKDPVTSVITLAAVSTTTVQFTSYDNEDHVTNLSGNSLTSGFTTVYPGAYFMDFSWTGTAVAGGTRLFFYLYEDGGPLDHGTSVRINNANDVESVGFSSIHTFTSDATVSVWVRSDSGGGTDVGTRAASFGMHKFADI